MRVFADLPSDKWAYSIYALNVDGTIGKYVFTSFGSEKYYIQNLLHMFKDLSRKSILSGNSAMFLAAIQNMGSLSIVGVE